MTETTIPMLPCRTSLIETTVDFCTALGFETTYLQKSPCAPSRPARGHRAEHGGSGAGGGVLEEAAGIHLGAEEREAAADALSRLAELRS
ncbi:hypothetical protein OH133_25275 [Streptomyces sp. VB1]|nr:hypothetical protein [Streptomyces sp. VB1]UZI31144.1 hypothetical protein OH133_25275 [Streptomyces sp. VB1]